MIVYTDAVKVVVTAISFYGIFCGAIIIISGVDELVQSIPVLIIITIAMRAYSMIFFKQVKLRIQTQRILQELQLAYEKVEELTLANERQRMARDLHDTLSQGLAGVIMQLEAVNANLSNDNIKRAAYEAREAELHDQMIRLKSAREEGIKEGIEKGVEKGKIEMAKNLLNMGLSSEQIAKAAGFSIDEIEKNKEKYITLVYMVKASAVKMAGAFYFGEIDIKES